MHKESVKTVFDDECKHLIIDSKLINRISKYKHTFLNKNEDHIHFFGGNLIGVYIVKFVDSDRNNWFDDVLLINDGPLEERLLDLPTINSDWKVSSDTMNLSCMWLTHAIMNSDLSPQEKIAGMLDTMSAMQYKMLTSRMNNFFKYPANKGTAEAAYAQLSYKFGIKVYGSWIAWLDARSEAIISESGIHHSTFLSLEPDKKIVNTLNDIKGRINDMLGNYIDVFKQTHLQGTKITSTSSSIEYDGESVLRDKVKNLPTYTRYINSIISDKNSFIKEELVLVIEKIMKTAPPKLVEETLTWMSNNYRRAGAGIVEEVVNETVLHSFEYLENNKSLINAKADLPDLLGKLRGIYMSSRSNDPILLLLRDNAEKMVKLATGNKNPNTISSVRSATLLYIVLRTFTMKYYSNN